MEVGPFTGIPGPLLWLVKPAGPVVKDSDDSAPRRLTRWRVLTWRQLSRPLKTAVFAAAV
jgi:hypothetical protein